MKTWMHSLWIYLRVCPKETKIDLSCGILIVICKILESLNSQMIYNSSCLFLHSFIVLYILLEASNSLSVTCMLTGFVKPYKIETFKFLRKLKSFFFNAVHINRKYEFIYRLLSQSKHLGRKFWASVLTRGEPSDNIRPWPQIINTTKPVTFYTELILEVID